MLKVKFMIVKMFVIIWEQNTIPPVPTDSPACCPAAGRELKAQRAPIGAEVTLQEWNRPSGSRVPAHHPPHRKKGPGAQRPSIGFPAYWLQSHKQFPPITVPGSRRWPTHSPFLASRASSVLPMELPAPARHRATESTAQPPRPPE